MTANADVAPENRHRRRRPRPAAAPRGSADLCGVEHLVEHACALEPPTAERAACADPSENEISIPPRLLAFETIRRLVVIGLVVSAVAACWLVVQVAEAGSDGALTDAARAALVDEARSFLLVALSLALPLVPIWTSAAAEYAKRCGAPRVGRGPHLALATIAVGSSAASWVLDTDQSTHGSSLALALAGLCAGVAGVLHVRAQRWFQLHPGSVISWLITAPAVSVTLLGGGLSARTASLGEVAVLMMAACLLALGCSLLVVLVALSAHGFENEVRWSPEMQVLVRRR